MHIARIRSPLNDLACTFQLGATFSGLDDVHEAHSGSAEPARSRELPPEEELRPLLPLVYTLTPSSASLLPACTMHDTKGLACTMLTQRADLMFVLILFLHSVLMALALTDAHNTPHHWHDRGDQCSCWVSCGAGSLVSDNAWRGFEVVGDIGIASDCLHWWRSSAQL